MSDFSKQFKKGVLELAILKLLTEEHQYGYAIIKEIKERSKENLVLKEGTLYPILYRLEDNKLIESYWNQSTTSRGKPRKYYKITAKGQTRFTNMYEDFVSVFDGIKSILDKE